MLFTKEMTNTLSKKEHNTLLYRFCICHAPPTAMAAHGHSGTTLQSSSPSETMWPIRRPVLSHICLPHCNKNHCLLTFSCLWVCDQFELETSLCPVHYQFELETSLWPVEIIITISKVRRSVMCFCFIYLIYRRIYMPSKSELIYYLL